MANYSHQSAQSGLGTSHTFMRRSSSGVQGVSSLRANHRIHMTAASATSHSTRRASGSVHTGKLILGGAAAYGGLKTYQHRAQIKSSLHSAFHGTHNNLGT